MKKCLKKERNELTKGKEETSLETRGATECPSFKSSFNQLSGGTFGINYVLFKIGW